MKSRFILLIMVFSNCSIFAQFKNVELGPKTSGKKEKLFIANPINYASNTVVEGRDLKVGELNKYELAAATKGFKIIATDKAGKPIAIEGISKKNSDRNLPIETRAINHIEEVSQILGLANKEEMFLKNIDIDNHSNSHLRFEQIWNGFPVFGSELIVHTSQGDIDFINGRIKTKPEGLAIAADINAQSAENKVRLDLVNVKDLSSTDKSIFNIEQSKSYLTYYEHNDEIKLAYHFTFYKNLIERWEYFIDATDGEVIHKYQSICKFHHSNGQKCNHGELVNEIKSKENVDEVPEANVMMDGPATATALDLFNVSRNLNTYNSSNSFYMIDAARTMFNNLTSKMPNDPVGTIWTIDGFNTSPQKDNFNYDHVKSSNNTWSSKTAVSAHYNGGKAYEYFNNIHGRNSINGSGGNIISFINVADEDGSAMDNAFWNGAAMFYGNGSQAFFPLARGLDVAGHEMAHGVVQNTANLVYQGEAGALNESFADVFGSLIDREDWLIGEDVVKTSEFPSGALRSMSNPHNGGTSLNSPGYQPKLYSERYTGSQDNGGVHINSGIPNYAYFLFASDPAVGKDRAEKVYYKALKNYLTKSSQFVDARVAIVRAAKEEYGDAIAAIATKAFDLVQIPGGSGNNYQDDVKNNPGQDLILFTTDDQQGLYIYTAAGDEIANPLSETSPISKPSITDDGSLIVFVGSDKKIHYIQINWTAGSFDEKIFDIGTSTWRNAAISKDGKRMSALRSTEDNFLWVFDLVTGKGNEFELTNPTFSEGVATGDVLYADAMEWDFTGENVMYDAKNQIKSTTSGTIDYWDIGFVKVWNKNANSFSFGKIDKLFPALDEGESVGNPTFSKNSPYIIAFDYTDGKEWAILGANTETNKIDLIAENTTIGYPSFSKLDNKVIYNYESTTEDLRIIDLDNSKIKGKPNTAIKYTSDAIWGVWFSNGKRNLSNIEPINIGKNNEISISPNPVTNELSLVLNSGNNGKAEFQIFDITGKAILNGSKDVFKGNINVDASMLKQGMYLISITHEKQTYTSKFVKQ